MTKWFLPLALAACSRPSVESATAAQDASHIEPTIVSAAPLVFVLPVPHPIVVPNNEKDCRAQHGKWKPDGYALPSCELPTHDGGKRCTDESDCEAGCYVDTQIAAGTQVTGTCAACYNCTGGCINEVHAGRARGGVCN